MVRINSTTRLHQDAVQVSHLDTLFLDRGVTYLSKYIAEAVQLYNGMKDLGRPDTAGQYCIRAPYKDNMAYIVTVLCVYLAIKDLAHIFDFHSAGEITYHMGFKNPLQLWDCHPYAVAIRLASVDFIIIWNEMLRYARDYKLTNYLSYFTLFKIMQDTYDVADTRDGITTFARKCIGDELRKENCIKYDLNG